MLRKEDFASLIWEMESLMETMKKKDKVLMAAGACVNQKNRYILLFLAIIILATALRFYTLDDRVFHHDEGVHGYLTYKLFKNGAYHYDPTYHGPFLY
ncbi:MAG: hypothetical protein KAV00_11690, partial [Phycisphaerae bacterium]|nr:hypothetical protein [Phycisphaerae bacterium]